MRLSSPTAKLATYYANLIAVGLIVGVLGPSLGDLAHRTGSTLAGVSLVLLLRPLGYLLGAFFCGFWFARHRCHPSIGVATLACAGLMALFPQAPTLAPLALLALLLGFAESLLDVGSNTLLPWVYGTRVGPYLSGMHFSFGVGAFVAPMVVAWSLTRHGGSAWAYRVLALALLPLAAWLFVVPSPEPHAPDGDASESGPDRGGLGLLMACFFLYGCTETGFGSWIYQYAVDRRLADVSQAALLNSMFWGLLGLGRLAGIPVLARFEARAFLAWIIPGAVLSLGLLLAFPSARWALWTGDAAMGLTMACIFPTLLVFAGRRLCGRARVSSRITSLLFVGSGAGSMFLPWVMGLVFRPWGPRAALGLTLGSVSGLLLLFRLADRPGRQDVSNTASTSQP